jgi:hypothetical protein
MDKGFVIPAAHIRHVDLSRVGPGQAAEIRRLGSLMERGAETRDEFVQLVRLLAETGFRSRAEYLLRRNYVVVENGLAL